MKIETSFPKRQLIQPDARTANLHDCFSICEALVVRAEFPFRLRSCARECGIAKQPVPPAREPSCQNLAPDNPTFKVFRWRCVFVQIRFCVQRIRLD